MDKIILVAGAAGNLGGKIVDALINNNISVRAIVRVGSDATKVDELSRKGVEVHMLNMDKADDMIEACKGIYCVVSALSGLENVIIDTQRQLLNAAIAARVPKFIPSDYSIDFTNLVPGKNRNLDLRREFHDYLKKVPIKVTTIFNGAFMDLLTGDMPLILFKLKRILYWGRPDVKMDLTTTYNVAEFTALAAVDADSPRFLHVAGDSVSAREVGEILNELSKSKYKLLRAGNILLLNMIIGIAKFFSGGSRELYPAWQGMQYMRDMMEGRAVINSHDNERYQEMIWTSLREFLQPEQV